ncbi:hypothetical protein BBJ28_00003457 [Nothophytophthora sp. Chile5]|nr:hypothetical protein BBJ28_00003457 [Nothophytophthora sp. Chile5]
MTRMLPPIFFCGQHVFDDGELCFDRDAKPRTLPVDRHGSKLVRKKVKRREQHYAIAMKASTYGSYAHSRASSHTASHFGGSRAPSVSVRSAAPTSKVATFLSWSQEASFMSKDPAAPPSIGNTARMTVDFVERQRRADIERDLSTRESQHRSTDEANRKGALRPKLRSLADPSISLEKEEAMAVLAASAARSRLQPSRQGTRGKTPGLPALSPLNCKPVSNDALDGPAIAGDENATFRTEDYEGLASEVVLLGKGGELVVGENCFVVARKPRQDLLLDLQQRSSVKPRVQLLATPKRDEETTNQVERSLAPGPWNAQEEGIFEGQIGLFESSPTVILDLKTTPLAKGVALKLAGTLSSPAQPSHSDLLLAVPDKTSGKAPIRESTTNAKLEEELGALLKVSDKSKSVLATESKHIPQKASAKSTPAASPRTAASPQGAKSSSAASLVLPKHIVRTHSPLHLQRQASPESVDYCGQHHGEKHLQSLRIRTPACPNRLSRKPSSRSSLLTEGDEDGWPNEGMESLFSLHEVQLDPVEPATR